ncbi:MULTISPECIES: DUF1799 domain-containing protein [Alcaligenes]|uniref:DUF1799 domain-containing protein n=1 Tax=Alcaligenes TaxID=507 RepID=UPI000E9886E5|nr:hypothetical protein [Alcaligenes faecalis]
MIEALKAAGAPDAVIQRVQQEEFTDFEVWPENEMVVEAFLHLSSCWTVVAPPMGDLLYFGLPSTEIESTLRLLGFPRRKRARVFRYLKDMERAALSVFYE